MCRMQQPDEKCRGMGQRTDTALECRPGLLQRTSQMLCCKTACCSNRYRLQCTTRTCTDAHPDTPVLQLLPCDAAGGSIRAVCRLRWVWIKLELNALEKPTAGVLVLCAMLRDRLGRQRADVQRRCGCCWLTTASCCRCCRRSAGRIWAPCRRSICSPCCCHAACARCCCCCFWCCGRRGLWHCRRIRILQPTPHHQRPLRRVTAAAVAHAPAGAAASILLCTATAACCCWCVLLLVAVCVENVHAQALVHWALQWVGRCLQLQALPLDEVVDIVCLHGQAVEQRRLGDEVQGLLRAEQQQQNMASAAGSRQHLHQVGCVCVFVRGCCGLLQANCRATCA